MKKIRILLLLLFVLNVSYAQETSEIQWWNPINSAFPVISGQNWPNEVKSIYHRLPKRAEKKVRRAVWKLSNQSAGLSIRFWTNANHVHVRYQVKGSISMPHMPSTGVSGLDLYSKSYDGEWLRCWGTYSISKKSNYDFVISKDSYENKKYGREYQLFLPLYNEVDSLEIGVDKNSFFEVLPIRKEKPIVAYGTSICQGACASRPGMAWTHLLERRLERPVINLGFSGNGKLEPELIDLMTEIAAKVYILDCLPNLRPDKDDVFQLILNAVKRLKEKRPQVPVILTAHIGYANELTHIDRNYDQAKLNKELNRAFTALQSKGYTNIFLLQKEDLALGFDSYVDLIHPNDYGMIQYADAYEKLIRKIIKEPKGNVSTTNAVTQSRDISVYKWEERHQQILALNRTNPPEICLFGNSIINFWGGEPTSLHARGQDSWESIMEPLGVRNFGFGWDRIENVLWRVYHDELDGFEAKKIVLMVGTNNLQLNNELEIINGLEKLIGAIRIRQPKSEILMVGILPRNGKEDQIERLNLKIAQLADLEGITYENVGGSLLLDDGKLDNSLFVDGLHPNGMGYLIIAKKLQDILKNR